MTDNELREYMKVNGNEIASFLFGYYSIVLEKRMDGKKAARKCLEFAEQIRDISESTKNG